ncbi:MAG: VWA domain-containing protein [Vicinamibacterales bacterium]
MRHIATLCSAGAVVLLLAAGTLRAGPGPDALQGTAQRPPAPRPADPAAKPALPEQPTFRVAVDLVTTDVIVRDGKGQFVADLKAGDFEVFEDGVKQDIASLVLIHGGRAFNMQQPPPPPVQEGIILPAQRPTSDAAGRIFLIFVDDLHLDFRNTGRIRQLFTKISKNLIHDGDMFGIVSTGPSSLAIDLTYDRQVLDAAIKKISGSGLRPNDIIQGAETSEGPSEVRYRAHVAFSTAYDLMRNLEKVHNRRKAVIYVSNGYDFNPFEQARLGEDPVFGGRYGESREENMTDPFAQTLRQGQQFADADLAREISELTRAANRANATMYTIDPRGLVAGADIDEQIDPVEWGNYVRKSQDSLRVLADLTGGIAVVNQNDFDKALKRIDAETSDYYVLGYYSTNPDPLKRTRRIEVKTRRPNAQVWSRTSYSLRPTPPATSSK